MLPNVTRSVDTKKQSGAAKMGLKASPNNAPVKNVASPCVGFALHKYATSLYNALGAEASPRSKCLPSSPAPPGKEAPVEEHAECSLLHEVNSAHQVSGEDVTSLLSNITLKIYVLNRRLTPE